MSKFEKIFWITIGILASIWLTLQVLAYMNSQKETDMMAKNEPVLTSFIKNIVEYSY